MTAFLLAKNKASHASAQLSGDEAKHDLARVSERFARLFQSRGMSVDSRLLIKQIEARPPLWNRDDKDYCHKQIVSKLWAEIALIHGVHESRVKSRWKALRDTFRQELKKNPEQSPWSYYLDMQFLKGQFKTVSANKPGVEGDFDEMTFVKTEPEETKSYYQEVFTRGKREESEGEDQGCASMDVELEEDRRQRIFDMVDDDYHFLMSLLSEMRRLEPRQKLLLRIKMMELFYKEAYQQEP